MLQLLKFQKTYGLRTVLTIDDLLIRPGIYWIRGANGSGKSTLLQSIGGIIDFSGNIILDEHVSLKKHPTAYRKVVNFAEAEPLFPEFLSGREMVALFSSAKKAPARQEERFIEEMAMNPYVDDPIGTYSSGMLKKLSLVLAFLGNPTLILLDEPLITLDADAIEILYRWIEEKYQKEGLTFLVSSHQALNGNDLVITNQLLVEDRTVKLMSL